MASLVKISPPSPGVVTEISDYQAQMRYVDSDLIRFRNTFPEKLGGWQQRDASKNDPLSGTTRTIISGTTNNSVNYAMYATNTHVYLESGQALYDVTPYRTANTSLTDPLTTGSAGTSVVTVTWASHGIVQTSPFSRVIITAIGTNTIDGITITEGEFFADVKSANTFEITPVPGGTAAISGTASSGGVTGGGTVELRALVNNGPNDSTLGFGFGAGFYGNSTWNTARSTGVNTNTRVWSLDKWGEDIVGSVGDGSDTIYYWDLTNLTSRGVTLGQYLTSVGASASQVPAQVGKIMVSTPDRHLVCFGCDPQGSTDFDPLTIRFASQESLSDWNADILNSAGDQRLGTGTTIRAVKKSKGQILIWTEDDLYGMQFIGPPFTFAFNQLGTRSGSLSANAAATVEGVAYWMDEQNFYIYDGTVKVLPCPVHNHVFGGQRPDSSTIEQISFLQAQKVFTAQVSQYNEIWWFYGADVTNIATGTITRATDINRYVIYNYVDNTWAIGESLIRTAWNDSIAFDIPIATDLNGLIYNQETGYNNVNAAMTSYIQTGYFNGDANGDQFFFIDRIIPDTSFAAGNTIKMEMNTKRYPKDAQFRSKNKLLSTKGTSKNRAPVFEKIDKNVRTGIQNNNQIGL